MKTNLNFCSFEVFKDWVIKNKPSKDWFLKAYKELKQQNSELFCGSDSDSDKSLLQSINVDEERTQKLYNDFYFNLNKKMNYICDLISDNPTDVIRLIKEYNYIPKDIKNVSKILSFKNEYLTKLLISKFNVYEKNSLRDQINDDILKPYVKSKDSEIRKFIASIISIKGLNLFVGETNREIIAIIISRYQKENESEMLDIMEYISKNENLRKSSDIINYEITGREVPRQSFIDEISKYKLNLQTDNDKNKGKESKTYKRIIEASEDQDKLYQTIMACKRLDYENTYAAILYLIKNDKISIQNLYRLAVEYRFANDEDISLYIKILPNSVLKLLLLSYDLPRTVVEGILRAENISFNDRVDYLYNLYKSKYKSKYGLVNFLASEFLRRSLYVNDISRLTYYCNKDSEFFSKILQPCYQGLVDENKNITTLLSNLNKKNTELLYSYILKRSSFTTIPNNIYKILTNMILKSDNFYKEIFEYSVKMKGGYYSYFTQLDFNILLIKLIICIYKKDYSDIIDVFSQLMKVNKKLIYEFENKLNIILQEINSYANFDNIDYYSSKTDIRKFFIIAQAKNKEFLEKVYEFESKLNCPAELLKFIKARYLDNNDIITDLPKQLKDTMNVVSSYFKEE